MVELMRLPVKERSEKPGFVRTPTSDRITNVFRLCQEFGDLGAVAGEPGVGKTASAREYALSTHGVRMVTMTPATSALVPCLVQIAQKIAGFAPNTGARSVRRVIVGKLADIMEKPLLILDEAQHLSDEAVEEIRSIYDESGAGIVFVGNRGLVTRWEAKPGAKRDTWAQLTSRLGPRIDISMPTREDIEAICDEHRIIGRKPREFLQARAKGPGGVRVVSKLIAVAAKLAGPEQLQLLHFEQAAIARGMRQ
jgi:DNA transposition AAA+ family ATPase